MTQVRQWRASAGGFAAALLGLLAACGGSEERPRDVILITIDTLRADHLGLYGYPRPTSPRIDEWFGTGRIFERSYSAEARTAPSVASILSGRHPQDHGIRLFYQLAPPGLELIPDLLPASYQTAAFVSNIVLTDEAMGIADHFDHYDDFVSQRESKRAIFERNAERTNAAVLEWMNTERDPGRPLFLWVHYIDPHGPYRAPADWPVAFEPQGQRPIERERIARYMIEPGVKNGYEYVDAYDEEITYVDEHVGRLLDELAQRLPVDDSLVVLTSDHGETMMEHERWFSHGFNVYEGIMRVPLLVRGPGGVPGRVEHLVSGIDVAPTILAFAGAEVPAGWEGVDLLSGAGLDAERIVFAEAASKDKQWRTAIHGDRKVRLTVTGERIVSEEVEYDLARDPGEVAGGTPTESASELVQGILARVASDPDPAGVPAQYEKGTKLEDAKVDPRADDAALEGLRALGYVDDGFESEDEPEVHEH